MSNIRGFLQWAPLLATTIVLAQMMNSVAVSYFERPRIVPTTPVVNTDIPQFDDRFLDAKGPGSRQGRLHTDRSPARSRQRQSTEPSHRTLTGRPIIASAASEHGHVRPRATYRCLRHQPSWTASASSTR